MPSHRGDDTPLGTSNMIVLQAPNCEDNLPALRASMTIESIDGGDNDAFDTLVDIPMLYDTGTQISIISADLLSPDFRDYLRSVAINEPYTSGAGFVQVSVTLSFTNVATTMAIIAVVRPAEAMSNNFEGAILGQRSAIDSIVAEMVPRRFCNLSEDLWGEIRISRVYDKINDELREY